MNNNKPPQKVTREDLEKRVQRLDQLLKERGEDGASLVRTWLERGRQQRAGR